MMARTHKPPQSRTLPREPTAVGDPVVLPRRSAPVVLGLVVTSLLTMLTGTQLVTEATRPSFQRTGPIELTLGSLDPVRADPPAGPAVRPGGTTGDPAGSTGGGMAAAPTPEATAVRFPSPDEAGDADGAEGGTRAVAGRATAGRARPAVPDATGPPDATRTVVGRHGLPCPERPRSDRLAGRSGGSCRAGGDDPAGEEPAPPPPTPAPESPLLELLPRRPDAPASDPEDGSSRPGSVPERRRSQSVASPRASGPPRGSSKPRPRATPATIQASTMALRPAPPTAGPAAPSSAGCSTRRKQRPPATPTGRRPPGDASSPLSRLRPDAAVRTAGGGRPRTRARPPPR
jgi:hypothetical protein